MLDLRSHRGQIQNGLYQGSFLKKIPEYRKMEVLHLIPGPRKWKRSLRLWHKANAGQIWLAPAVTLIFDLDQKNNMLSGFTLQIKVKIDITFDVSV